MGRPRVRTGREVCRMLKTHGFIEVRRHGSHIVMQRRTDAGSFTVPVPDHRELAVGTLLSICPVRFLALERARDLSAHARPEGRTRDRPWPRAGTRRGRSDRRSLPPHVPRSRVRRVRDGHHHVSHGEGVRQALHRPAGVRHAAVPPRADRL
ncbi:MAG: type II toxin-antitoxin system HicA family toxin [Candidatus Rokuibacteriota bacterium]